MRKLPSMVRPTTGSSRTKRARSAKRRNQRAVQKAKAVYLPHVDTFGDLTWSNDLDLDNPEPVNIMGPRGPQGEALTYDMLTDENKADLTRDFITCSQNITRIEIVYEYLNPEDEEEGVLYIRVSDQ